MYQRVVGLKDDLTGAHVSQEGAGDCAGVDADVRSDEQDEDEEEESEEDDESEEGSDVTKTSESQAKFHRPRNESPNSRKVTSLPSVPLINAVKLVNTLIMLCLRFRQESSRLRRNSERSEKTKFRNT